MATGKQASTKRLKMTERAQQQMDIHFKDMSGSPLLWNRKTNDGFTTIPRTLPIVMQGIDSLSKGQPAGHTLFCLWARSPDHALITIENPITFAAEAGFIGERAVDTWRRRMRKLRELNFIRSKTGPSGEFHYVLLLNPNIALEALWQSKHIQEGLYSRFIDRAGDIGAYAEIEAIQKLWSEENAAKAKAKSKVKDKGSE